MARRRQQRRSRGEDRNEEEGLALLSHSQEQNLGNTGAEDADQYDEHAPLNVEDAPDSRTFSSRKAAGNR